MTITERGVFTVSKAAVELMGQPGAVEQLYDRDARVVGLRPVERGTANAYALKDNGGTRAVSASAFCRHYGIAHERTTRYEARFDAELGVLCVDLSKPGVPVTSNRKRAKG